jgi:hypothetical protein
MQLRSLQQVAALRRWAGWQLRVAKAAAGPHGAVRRRLGRRQRVFLEADGICPICERRSHFVAEDPWLRDHFLCVRCGSIPRERALMAAIQTFRPSWRKLAIHESSPGFRGVSPMLRRSPRRSARRHDG